ncbi:MAG: 3-hydroxyacyl-CoA dehydrogenase/enoyl-CoA hydratase family protein [Candidatus Poseidoniaceae archaeon]|nr:3-hydroxyacyl-CoA dehydrogenase/enoyl-CoA hydratase family protein [Candidatus Poseidoniaceae archaeon]
MTLAVQSPQKSVKMQHNGGINKVAVIGSGIMGAGIAAHCANAGCDVLLYDIVPNGAEDRSMIARDAIGRMKKSNPEVLMHPSNSQRIHPVNLEDDLALLGDRDWVIEVVVERLDIKHTIYSNIEEYLSENVILSSNTSTIPRSSLVDGMSPSLASKFLITHFFNPPRYLPLLEIVAGEEVVEDLYHRMSIFASERLGKRVTLCNDTPGFIGNRLGIYFVQRAIAATLDHGFTVEQADAMLGRPIGLPKTGVFALMDLVGIDIIPAVVQSMVDNLPPEDALHEIAGKGEDIIEKMISEGYTGRKGKGGFFRLNTEGGTRIKEARSLVDGTYDTANRRAAFTSAKIGRQGLKRLMTHPDEGAAFVKEILLDTFAYAASLVPEVSEDIAAIDGAMRVGYNWKKGPFEMMDSIGLEWLVGEMVSAGIEIPSFLALAAERGSFYGQEGGEITRLDFSGELIEILTGAEVTTVADIKRRRVKPIRKNASASIWDANDGVLLVEFHSKMNALDPLIMEILLAAVDLSEDDEWKGILIANDSANFCAGANLGLALFAANLGAWSTLEDFIALGQDTYQALKYAEVPVVSAASGMCLGGGCEILLHSDGVVAHSESYIGLVEAGVGIVPAWGGCKEMLARLTDEKLVGLGPMAAPMQAFENIGMAKVAKSAHQAKDLGYLRKRDRITMNRDRVMSDAKSFLLELAQDYSPPSPNVYHLPGPSGLAALKMALNDLAIAGHATPHDLTVVGELAKVLTGGECDHTDELSEEDILALERKAIASLARNELTLARMEHMLAKGKPLRN